MGEFWDTHDLGEYWDKTRAVNATFNFKPSKSANIRIEPKLASRVRAAAKRRGVSTETLLNSWVREKLSAK